MKNLFFLLFLFVSLLVGCSNQYDSLDEAIQNEHKTPIQILNTYEGFVLYIENNNQYIFGKYTEENGKFTYDNSFSKGWVFDGEMLVRTDEELGNQPLIFGAVKDKDEDIETFNIYYNNGLIQSINAKNNTFIAEYKGETFEEKGLMHGIKKVEAERTDGTIYLDWKK